jgi:hypothetical protein
LANAWDAILIAGVLVVGVVVVTRVDWASMFSGFGGGGGDDPTASIDASSEATGGSSNCKTLCSDADCSGYDDEGCTAGCSACKGGSSGSSSGSGSSSAKVNCDDGNSCSTRCSKGWCKSYNECCPGGSCGKCSKPDATRELTKGCPNLSNCPQCKGTNQYRMVSNCKCGCATYGSNSGACKSVTDCPVCGGGSKGSRQCKSGKCGCGSGSSSSGGSSSGGSSSKPKPKPAGGGCTVTKCPQCGAYPNYRICKNNNTACGCAKVGAMAKVVSNQARALYSANTINYMRPQKPRAFKVEVYKHSDNALNIPEIQLRKFNKSGNKMKFAG